MPNITVCQLATLDRQMQQYEWHNIYFQPQSTCMKLRAFLSLLYIVFLMHKIQAQVVSDSILIDGNFRSFSFQKPQDAEAGRSLVFILHGSGGTGRDMMNQTTKLEERSAPDNVLFVYPNGYKRYWNECRKAASSLANKENIDEAAFFERLIHYFKDRYKINERQVFALGSSGGGHMCYKLGLTMPEKFRAIAALIANLPDNQNMDCKEAKVAIPVMIVNGTADQVNPYEGGMMKGGSFIMGTVRSTEQTFQYWAELAGYNGKPSRKDLPDTDPTDGKIIERYTYSDAGKPEIVLLKVIGGKHDEPNDIDVYREGWEFFKRQIK